MKPTDLELLIEYSHVIAKSKGFWPQDSLPSQGQQLMLVISELGEALEADRHGKEAQLDVMLEEMRAYEKSAERMGVVIDVDSMAHICFYAHHFETTIKDSVADELADAYIRLCDFAGGFGLDLSEIVAGYEMTVESTDLTEISFGELLLGVTQCVLDIFEDEDQGEALGMCLTAIEYVAESRAINLITHVELKLHYNATRPHKHGKAY
jgi:hypothetical protein